MAEIDLPLKKQDLYLVVSGEDGISHDWADWLEPKVSLKGGKVVDLTGPQMGVGHDRARKGFRSGKNCEGRPLKVGGKGLSKRDRGACRGRMIHFKTAGRGEEISGQGGPWMTAEPSGMGARRRPRCDSIVFDKKPTKIPEGQAEPFDPDSLEPQKVPVTAFEVPDDLEVTVWATSPMLLNPTNMDTDAAGVGFGWRKG